MKRNNTVLVVDGGGRGATLVHKYSQSKYVGKLIAIPGNDLIKLNCKKPLKIFPNLKTTSIKEILEIAKLEKVDLVDVAQDNAVAVGLVDALIQEGISVVGPTKAAGQIEWSKDWSRSFMKKYNLPIPDFKPFKSTRLGIKYIKSLKEQPFYIKASGLTFGKGVYFAKTKYEAAKAVYSMKQFGKEGQTFLVEETLIGEEFSSYAISDGNNFKIIGHAQDNKRAYNFDEGENTGGIGCTSKPLVITKQIEKQIEEIFRKTFAGLSKEGRLYTGILYLGGMIVGSVKPKVYVIEFNSRWGDPEIEVVLPAVVNDLFEVSMAVVDKKVGKLKIKNDGNYRIAVTAAPKGYPGDYSNVKGKKIFGIENAVKVKNVKIYGAGVKKKNGNYIVSSGRLVHVVGVGKNVIEARKWAYQAMSLIYIEGNNLHYRTDIGSRDIERIYR